MCTKKNVFFFSPRGSAGVATLRKIGSLRLLGGFVRDLAAAVKAEEDAKQEADIRGALANDSHSQSWDVDRDSKARRLIVQRYICSDNNFGQLPPPPPPSRGSD